MKHKVKSAIILAAGRGSRLNNRTKDIPKPLLTVNGEILIERMIRQLKKKGIKDIYVVVGYKRKKFEYLKELFNVTLIYNPRWFRTNNITSFIKVFESRKDSLNKYATAIFEADMYLKNEDIILTEIEKSGYYIEFTNEIHKTTTEWKVKLCGANKQQIVEVIMTGANHPCYILRGMSFWTPADFKKIYSLANYSIELDKKVLQLHFDRIPCELHIDKFELFPYIYEEDSILEVDNEQDYIYANEVLK